MWYVDIHFKNGSFRALRYANECEPVICIGSDYTPSDPDFMENLLKARRMLPFIIGVEDALSDWQATGEKPPALDKSLQSWHNAYQRPYPAIQKRIADIEALIDPPSPQPIQKPYLKQGYVYLLKSEHGYKIGYSKSPTSRHEQIDLILPFETELICTHKTDDMIGLERRLHERFADKRINGEWFDLSEDDVTFIREMF
jgi:hypothetical protein